MVTDAHGKGAGRPASIAKNKAVATHAFGYDEYFQLAERLKWKTILVVNLYDGLLTDKTMAESARHAAGLMAYCIGRTSTVPESLRDWPVLRAANGHPKPYAVEYVQIGNEAWFFEEGMKAKYGDAWLKVWADAVEAYIAALKQVKPDIKVIVDIYPLAVSAELHRRKAAVDLYTLHRYYPMAVTGMFTMEGKEASDEVATPAAVWGTLVHSTETNTEGQAEWQDKAFEHAAKLGLRMAMTEWNLNGWFKNQKRWPGLGACGLGASVMLNALLRRGDRVELATQSMLVGCAWGIAGIRVDPKSGKPPMIVPTAAATTLYGRNHGDRRLEVRVDTEPPKWQAGVCFSKEHPGCTSASVVDVVATRDRDRLYLHIVNTDYGNPHRLSVKLEGLSASGRTSTLNRLRFLTKDEVKAKTDGPWAMSETERISFKGVQLEISLPPRSATIAVIPLRKVGT
jgi:alpha-L-arabinofuranosidase